ncbi:glycosyltransferase family 2 protein [Dokdonia ponticola]|uniref:Glycosyltransferase family 2 protein n=1 Tax=Dokdonia ponticola TaxID=2041041 RepID=A0ABV9I1K5_9FLAO
MMTLLFPYRGREVSRVKRSLDSLLLQSNKDFQVAFIDYGTPSEKAAQVKELVTSYAFASYQYSYHIDTMWNKSRALNILIKELKTSHCFVADIDMIFHPDFIRTLHELKTVDHVVYFQVGFLSEEETQQEKSFEDYTIKFKSAPGATGLSMFPVKALQEVRGFDEYYHLWGSEDTDIHDRLKHKGLSVYFYDKQLLMLHQYHKIYRNLEDSYITKNITIKDIARKNYTYRLERNEAKATVANLENHWGAIQTKETYDLLLKPESITEVPLQKKQFTHWLSELHTHPKTGIHRYDLKGDNHWLGNFKASILGKYTLKSASDSLLWFHINHFRYKRYLYTISADCKTIRYTIWL